ncbi:MAG TPA: hypothetical protein VEP90_12940 [Methylomirabilota bacterium]|nr:hypothetical protein [Methylomirabilota bacterium]
MTGDGKSSLRGSKQAQEYIQKYGLNRRAVSQRNFTTQMKIK